MKHKRNFLFAVLLVSCLAASAFGADEGQEKVTVLHQAEMKFDKAGKVPTVIKFAQGQQPTVAAFLQEYKRHFQISDDNQLQAFYSSHDELGSHHRYLQHYMGIPIIGAEYIVHERNGAVWLANGQLVHG